jgi:hypothetical protein
MYNAKFQWQELIHEHEDKWVVNVEMQPQTVMYTSKFNSAKPFQYYEIFKDLPTTISRAFH